MNKDKIKEVAKSLMFDVNEQVLNDFEEFFESHLEDLELLKAIDTEGIEPMDRVDETPKSFLRDDVVEPVALPKEKLLANAPQTEGDFVALPKAVKND